jgi:hypothetical protein
MFFLNETTNILFYKSIKFIFIHYFCLEHSCSDKQQQQQQCSTSTTIARVFNIFTTTTANTTSTTANTTSTTANTTSTTANTTSTTAK